ncbi:MAG TPA: YrhC family protein [Bacillales bacterium]|nr:YrhC family protein [Bacillales bacterium]
MNEKQQIELKSKMTDYRRFSAILLFVSATLSMGAVVPFQGRTGFDEVLLSIAGIAFMIGSGLFYRKVGRMKQQYENEQM